MQTGCKGHRRRSDPPTGDWAGRMAGTGDGSGDRDGGSGDGEALSPEERCRFRRSGGGRCRCGGGAGCRCDACATEPSPTWHRRHVTWSLPPVQGKLPTLEAVHRPVTEQAACCAGGLSPGGATPHAPSPAAGARGGTALWHPWATHRLLPQMRIIDVISENKASEWWLETCVSLTM